LASVEPLISSNSAAALAVALEGIEAGAVEAGLPQPEATALARQAFLGSVLLLADTYESPASLKDRVASPGGTTIAGLAALENQGARGMLMRVVQQGTQAQAEGRDR
jgi:pyrroline-5-carboxylate reductase